MGRIVVLGIDELEYSLVEEWDLKYLKQNAYSKTDLSDFKVIVTPPIWASMLVGKKTPEIEIYFVKRQKLISQESNIERDIKNQFIPKSVPKFSPDLLKRK